MCLTNIKEHNIYSIFFYFHLVHYFHQFHYLQDFSDVSDQCKQKVINAFECTAALIEEGGNKSYSFN